MIGGFHRRRGTRDYRLQQHNFQLVGDREKERDCCCPLQQNTTTVRSAVEKSLDAEDDQGPLQNQRECWRRRRVVQIDNCVS